MKIKKKCINCKLDFLRFPSEIKKGKCEFCSHRCKMSFTQKSGGLNLKTGTMKHRGYILEWAPQHPNQVKGYVYQHRCIVERHLGRFLKRKELVHHKNHVKDDNRLGNLELMSHKEHRIHHSGILIKIGKKVFCWADACKFIGISRGSARKMRIKKKLTHQEIINFYLEKRRL